MGLSEEEKVIYRKLEKHADKNGVVLNPDKEVVKRVVKGLFMISKKKGEAYCPCRLTTGKPEIDKNIICPCKYHLDEIKENGKCLCNLFVAVEEGNFVQES